MGPGKGTPMSVHFRGRQLISNFTFVVSRFTVNFKIYKKSKFSKNEKKFEKSKIADPLTSDIQE